MANLKVSEQAYPSTRYTEAAAPSTPASGEVITYAKADGLMYAKDDAGVETALSNSGGGSVATDSIWDATGDLAVGSGANTAAKLTAGSDRRLLQIASGTPAWGLPHAWGCIISGTSTALSTGAYTTLSFGAADTYDPDGYHDPSGAPTLITIPSGLGGIYLLQGYAVWPSGSSNDRRLAYRINGGTDQLMNRWNWSISSVSNTHSFSVVIFQALAANDTVEVRMFTNLGSTTSVEYRAALFLIGVS